MKNQIIALAIAGSVALILILRELDLIAPAGIRRNNPGNIRPLSTGLWAGQSGIENNFCVFSSAQWGLRAVSRTLYNYRVKHNIKTIAELANRWAPSVENDTNDYINGLVSAMGVSAVHIIDLRDPETNLKAMRGIIVNENGYKFPGVHWFSDADLKTAQSLAGIK